MEIPLLFWFSDGFRTLYGPLIETLSANRNRRFMTDVLTHSIFDLVGIRTDHHSYEKSLFRPEFVERKRRTLNGAIDYDHYADPLILARNSIAELHARSPTLEPKVWAWTGSSRGSLGQALGIFSGVALEVAFNETLDGFNVLRPGGKVGMTLWDALEFLHSRSTETQLYLRLRNLEERSAPRAVATLIALDEAYDLGERVTVATTYVGEHLRGLTQLGFRVAFVLDGKRTAWTAVPGSVTEHHRQVQAALALADTHGFHTLAFDARAYPLLKEGLKPPFGRTITNCIVLEPALGPSAAGFGEFLSHTAYVSDDRIIAIVVPFVSRFDR